MSGIEEHASQASVDRFLRHTAGIVNGVRIAGTVPVTGRPADDEQPGTGCFVRWGPHHMILTARHVIEGAPLHELRVFSYPLDGYKAATSIEAVKNDITAVAAVILNSGSIHNCTWEDLALVTVHPSDFPGAEFVDLAKDWIDPQPGESVDCCGFPSDFRVTVGKTMTSGRELVDIGLLPIAFSGAVLSQPSESDAKFKFPGFDASRQYLVPYPSSPLSQHPRGISGAAMWQQSDEKMIVWRPNFKFAGTCTSCYGGGAVIEVVKASVVRRFLESVFGPVDKM